MATKEIQYYKNGGSPFITVRALPEPVGSVDPQHPNDVHFYHYPAPAQPAPPNQEKSSGLSGQSYFVVANISYGRLTAIDPVRSTPGVGGLPSQVLSELQNVYAHIPNAVVMIINTNGKFTIQAQFVADREPQQNGLPQQNGIPPQINLQQNGFSQNNGLPQHHSLQQRNGVPQQQPLTLLPQNLGQQYQIPGQYAVAPGQPVYYISPRAQRPRGYDDEFLSDSDSGNEYDQDGRRRRRRKDDGRPYLQKKYEELYLDDEDDYDQGKSGRRDGRDNDYDRRKSGRTDRRDDYDHRKSDRNDRRGRDRNQNHRSARTERDISPASQAPRGVRNIYHQANKGQGKHDRNLDNRSLDSRVLGDRRR